MFISGVTNEVGPPINDLWTVAGQQDMLADWQAEDRAAMETEDPLTYCHARQLEEFLDAIVEDRPPAVDGTHSPNAVEIFIAVYRSRCDGRPVRFPLDAAEQESDHDGRHRGATHARNGTGPRRRVAPPLTNGEGSRRAGAEHQIVAGLSSGAVEG